MGDYDLVPAQRREMMSTLDDFIRAQEPDKKIMFMGALAKYAEQGDTGSFAMNSTIALLYSRLGHHLEQTDPTDNQTRNIINGIVNHYLDQAGFRR